VVKRFLFNGVESHGGHFFEKFAVKIPFFIDPDIAKPMLIVPNHTVVGAEFAFDDAIFERFIIQCPFHPEILSTNLQHSYCFVWENLPEV
jgi:hypothetical protein